MQTVDIDGDDGYHAYLTTASVYRLDVALESDQQLLPRLGAVQDWL